MSDTIVALATPAGRSGIGVVRLSGSKALEIAGRLTRCDDIRKNPRTALLKQIHDPLAHEGDEIIDEALITYFIAPRSFTGEDVIEIACHGSPVVLRRVIDLALKLGARLAEPGEFTLRALRSGRIDLARAEAIRDLINARTAASAQQAVRQMRGEFSHELQEIREALLDVIVALESALEFVEDDLPETQLESLLKKITEISAETRKKAETFRAGKLLREGLKAAIVGRPNVGKSSLFNALLGSERAIVTDIAGTTRDQLYESFTIGDIPVSIIDTAGLRETHDLVESIGVERSHRTMADADLVLVVLDAAEALAEEDKKILNAAKNLRHILVLNKMDKLTAESQFPAFLLDLETEGNDAQKESITRMVKISAKTGTGLEELKNAIIKPFYMGEEEISGFLVTDARHYDLLIRSANEMDEARELLAVGTSEEIVLVGLHNALRYLGEITGETTTEDMLTRIFSTFCIGK